MKKDRLILAAIGAVLLAAGACSSGSSHPPPAQGTGTTSGGSLGADSGAGAGAATCGDGGCPLATNEAGCPGRSFLGFEQFEKCMIYSPLWEDAGAPEAGTMSSCLASCETSPIQGQACYFVDGTGTQPKNCGICPLTSAGIGYGGGQADEWVGMFDGGCP